MKTKWRTDLPEGDACLVGANLLTIDGGGWVRVGHFRFKYGEWKLSTLPIRIKK